MNQDVANAVSRYVQTLYDMNQKCLLLCGADLYNGPDYIIPTLELICAVPRVVPYKYDKQNGIIIYKSNGLLEYDSEISYLQKEYSTIIDSHKDLLNRIRLVRNKYEHKMHDVKWRHSSNGSLSLLEIGFEISYNGGTEYVDISLKECIPLLKQLNELFDRIIEDVKNYAFENGKTEYAYYNKLCQHEFSAFNKIYESELLVTVGKVFGPY